MCEKLSELIFNNINDGVFTVDENCRITSFNNAAERITGFTVAEAVGKHCFDVFRTEICHKQCALKDTLSHHDPVDNVRVTLITRDGREVPISVPPPLLKDESDVAVGAVEFFRDVSEVEHLRNRLEQKEALSEIVSVSSSMQKLISMLPDIAESECNVLILGPSGCGKELFAHVIHNLSPRRYGPHIKINCAALPETLLESELFGYTKGAFTDAKRDKPGQFSLANDGTLLLDEISEMTTALQVKLLRVLNNGEYRPLGSAKTLYTNARIIAATNANPEKLIVEGRFREDLYYRLNVVEIKIPPLRERPEDIPLLVNHYLKRYQKKSRKKIQRVSPDAIAVLRKCPFPGNVRELQNAIEHAFVMCHGDDILVEHLPQHVIARSASNGTPRLAAMTEKESVLRALERSHGNKSRAAFELGMHRSTLWRKIKTLGIDV